MKKIKLTVVSMILLTCAFMLMGFDSTQQKVYDDAGILTSTEESKLQQLCTDAAQTSKIDIIIVTTLDNQGKTSLKYAQDFYSSHEFGYNKASGDCVILVIDMEGREVGVRPFGSGQTYLSEVRTDNIISAVKARLTNADYNGACELFVTKMENYMKSMPSSSDKPGDGNTDFTYNQTFSQKLMANMGIKVLIAIGIGVVAVLAMMFNAKAKMSVGCQTYVKDHNFDVRDTRDIFLNTTVVTHKIETNKGGGGGSMNSGSGGSSFSGGSSKF